MTWSKKEVLWCILRPSLLIMLFLQQTITSNHDCKTYKDGDVVIGGMLNIHYSETGDQCNRLSTIGLGNAEAIIYAIERINKDSTLLPNVTIGYDLRDCCRSHALAMQIAYDLMREGDPVCMSNQKDSLSLNDYVTNNRPKSISALVGPFSSGSAVLVGSLLQVSDIPAISPSATSKELSSQMYKDFFRTVPPDNWQAEVMADIIERFNWTYVAAVGLDDSYGRNGISALEKESYDRKTFCIAFSEYIPRLGSGEKIKQIVLHIKRKTEIAVIIVWLSGGYGRAFFAEATAQNLEEKTWILSDALTAGEAVFLESHFTILNGSLGIKPRDHHVPDFEEHLKMITPVKSVERGTVWWEEFWRLQFNCSATKSNDSGIAPCKTNLTLHHALSKVRSPFVSYLIDAVYAIAHALDNIYSSCSPTIHGVGKGDECPSVEQTVKGSDLEKYIRNVSFDGWTGKVQFDKFGDPLTASYDIINFQFGSTTNEARQNVWIGGWNKNDTPKLMLNMSRLRWQKLSTPLSFCSSECLPGTRREMTSPCCWDCIKCPKGTVSTEIGSTNCTKCDSETKSNDKQNKCEKLPIINITHTTASGIAITFIALIGFILTLLVFGIFINFYNTPIVKASNREISFLLLFGISALFILAVLEHSEPNNLLCIAVTFWRYFALNLCVTVLFLKTMRITSVFEVDKVAHLSRPCFKTLKRQLIFISVVNALPISLLVLWMSVDPPGSEKIIRLDQYIFLVCKLYYCNIGFVLFITVSSYLLTVALLCTYYAFKARGIPENFNETKYIGFSMYILLLSSIAYYPVVFSFDSWYVTLVSCLTTLVSAFGLLGCMFGPRVYIILFRPQQNTVEYVRSQVSSFSFENMSETRASSKHSNAGVTNTAKEPANTGASESKLCLSLLSVNVSTRIFQIQNRKGN